LIFSVFPGIIYMAPELTAWHRMAPGFTRRMAPAWHRENKGIEMSTKLNFTKQRLAALKPQKARIYYQDDRTEGLSVCVTPAGAKIFYVVKWHDGHKVRLRLGAFPALSVEDARRGCQKAVAKMAEGIDPQAARQAARHEQTINGLWEHWLEYANGHKKPRSVAEDERQYKVFLKPWASRKLSVIHQSEVRALHTRIGTENGTYAANRVLALVKSMYNKAGDIGYTGVNPAVGIKKFKEIKRDRFLQGDELPAFFQSLAAEPNTLVRDFFLLCLLTGARKSNVLTMTWHDLDLTAARWRIPDTKAGVPHVVALVSPAVAVLAVRYKARNGSQYVFPGVGKSGHLIEPKAAWKRIVNRAGLADVRIHDLRRSLGSWQAIGGASLPIIGRSLGHTQPATTAIYARLQLDPVRQSVDSATAAMLTAGGASISDGGITIDVKATEGNGNAKA
jgi:integrase